MTKEQVEQKYQDCGCDIHRTISVILDGASNDGKSIIRVLHGTQKLHKITESTQSTSSNCKYVRSDWAISKTV